jgi:hypothetical protein
MRMQLSWSRLQQAGAAVLLLLPPFLIWLRCTHAPQTIFVSQDPRGYWIMAPDEVTALPQPSERGAKPATTFTRVFEGTPGVGPVRLHVRALRELELELNGERVPLAQQAENWKRETTADLNGLLAPGSNELRATVRNPRGPALLALRVEGLADPLGTDASWTSQHEGAPVHPAIIADDTRPLPGWRAGPLTWRSVERRGALLLGLFLASGMISTLRNRPGWYTRLPKCALALGLLLFSASVLRVYARIPVQSGFGFDLGNHLTYVEFVLQRHALPLATDGWSMYHPPLFYVASALLSAAFAAWLPGLDPASALRVLPFLSGLTLVAVSWSLARTLAPGNVRALVLATLFAAAVPVNLYMAVYPSNEAPHAALAALALLITVRGLLVKRAGPALAAGTGVLLGLALLTKFTALILVPVVAFFLACKLWVLERASAARIASQLLIFALALMAPCGLWYVRNISYFGRPFVGNWDLPGDALVWWQYPGFHTAAYYTHFGAALERPLYSGLRSFWDSLYSTFWADGYLGGRAGVLLHPASFDYELMAAVALLALPATLALVAGAFRVLARALNDPDGHRRAAFSFLVTVVVTVGFAMFYVTLELPFFAQARAPYGLLLVPLLGLFFALGLAPREGERWYGGAVGEALLAGWLGALFGASWLSLWA